MSLNWKEINLILEELAMEGKYIRKIFQRDYRNIYIKLFSPEKSYSLRVSLEQGRVGLYESDTVPPSRGKQPRFSEFLRARIKGGRVEFAAQIGAERIVNITVRRGGEKTVVYLKLWGNAANIIVCDDKQKILEAAYRRPKRSECAGKIFQLPESSEEQIQKLALVQPRAGREGLSYNQSIAADYKELENAANKEHLLKEVRRYYSMREQSLSARISRIEKAAKEAETENRLRELADLILSRAWKGDNFREEDYGIQEQETLLDPALSPVENAQKLYARAKKLRARSTRLGDEKANVSDNLERAGNILRLLDKDPSLAKLREIHRK